MRFVKEAPDRRALSMADVAGMLEMRLHQPEVTAQHVAIQARHAADLGLAAVICRPEHVAIAAEAVRDRSLGVCAAVDFTNPTGPLPDPDSIVEDARYIARAGATSLAMVVNAARLQDDSCRDALARLTQLARRAGATSRALIDARGLTIDQAVEAAVLCREAGVAIVQAGSWANPQAPFTLLGAFRSALGPDIILKWTRPIRSIDALLLGVAEGAQLFNTDIDALIDQATRRQQWLPLTVPQAGHDY